MTRVFLVNPPSPEPVRTPLLSFCHLGASLRAAGHEVALLDASAPFAPSDHDAIEARIAAFSPDVVGLHIKTLHVQPAYALAARLEKRWPLIAGGPHPTVCPDEHFAHGFRYLIRGEGEEALVELGDALDGKRGLDSVAGLSFFDRGILRHNTTRPFLTDLDRLAPPLDALDLFDPAWYVPASTSFMTADVLSGAPPPAGILSSRGCPAACTFCSNNVTGRRFRYRSPQSVTAEVAQLGQRHGLHCFSFFDDSFAVGRRRVRELCGALSSLPYPIYWTCTAHPAHLDPDILREMKRAGCAIYRANSDGISAA